MLYTKENLYDTTLPVMQIKKKRYPHIGIGGEGKVYRYNDQIAFKIFRDIKNEESYAKKFRKIEYLAKLHDESFTFPIGLIGFEDGKKEGYYTNLVTPNYLLKDFTELYYLDNQAVIIDFLVKADAAMCRIHQKGVILGDIKGNNIMIDQNNRPIYVDTDNYAYAGFDFDLTPGKAKQLAMAFNKNFSQIDSDIYAFALMAMRYLIKNIHIEANQTDYFYSLLLEYMDVEKEIKDGLREIFSDADNKPYIGPILQRVKTNKPILSKTSTYRINRIFYN